MVEFEGDSDAHIVRGLVAIMLALFSGRRASQIVATDAEETLREFGLDEHLTPQRANGLRSMVKRIKREIDRVPPGLDAKLRAKLKREGVSLRALTLGLWKKWIEGGTR